MIERVKITKGSVLSLFSNEVPSLSLVVHRREEANSPPPPSLSAPLESKERAMVWAANINVARDNCEVDCSRKGGFRSAIGQTRGPRAR